MILKGCNKNINISEKKIINLIKFIKKMNIKNILNYLSYNNKKSSLIIKKILLSIISNAEYNFGISKNNLYIYKMYTGKGIIHKKINYRAKGKSDKIIKKTSNIYIYIKTIKN